MPRKKSQSGDQNHQNNNKQEAQSINVSQSFHLDFATPSQKLAWMAYQKHDLLFLLGAPGSGKTYCATAFAIHDILKKQKEKIYITRPTVESGPKESGLGFLPGPQPLTAKVLTPNGWTTMGELKVGDEVIGRDGLPTKVLKIFPKGKKLVYKISTTDGTSTEACEDHLWFTKNYNEAKHNKKWQIRTTKQIKENLRTNKDKINYFLPRNEAVHFNNCDLPLSPYTLGVLLGDGCFGNGISIANDEKDNEIIERVRKELKLINCSITRHGICCNIKADSLNSLKPARKILITNCITQETTIYNSASELSKSLSVSSLTIKSRCNRNAIMDNMLYSYMPLEKRWSNPIKNIVDDLGLLYKKASQKFIPNIYKYSSIQNRIDLLKGLMDTDGNANRGHATFTTTSLQLAKDVIEIVQSLGGRAVLKKRDRVGRQSHMLNNRKVITKLVSYEFNISLPNDINPFYLKRKAINFKQKYMHRIGIKSIEPVCEKEVQCILVDNSEHLYITDEYIVTHNTFNEKIHPYMVPMYESIDKICGKHSKQKEFVIASHEAVPLQYLRGRTTENCVFILDEAQNATKEQLKLAITRMGQNCKMIITGDPDQSDLSNSGLEEVVSRISGVSGVGLIRFKENSIVRHPLLAKILKHF